jgi:hypothetical protein
MYRCLNGNFQLSDLEIWKVENPELQDYFDKNTDSLLRVPCWISADELPDTDGVNDICRRGFQFNGIGGMIFSTGVIDFNKSSNVQLVYCEVAVGRAFVQDRDIALVSNLPPGYNSFYIPKHALDRNEDGEFSLNEYEAAANFEYRNPR